MIDIYTSTDKGILLEIGQNLKRDRLLCNITQKEVAIKAGIALSSVNKIEHGQSVTFLAFIAYLRVLGRLDWLHEFFREPEPGPIMYAKMLNKRYSRRRASGKNKL